LFGFQLSSSLLLSGFQLLFGDFLLALEFERGLLLRLLLRESLGKCLLLLSELLSCSLELFIFLSEFKCLLSFKLELSL
jgi:hypothetical protein